jgi:hypothetical protein
MIFVPVMILVALFIVLIGAVLVSAGRVATGDGAGGALICRLAMRPPNG